MSLLAQAKKGLQASPLRTLIYGPEGVGKSTFLMGAPEPFFLGTEDGLGHLGPARLEPKTWPEALGVIRELGTTSHGYRTLAIDTLDWLEFKITQYVCERDNGVCRSGKNKPLETIVDGKPDLNAYPYGEGYKMLLAEWRVFVFECDRLRAKGIHIVMASHLGTSKVRMQDDDDYKEDGPNISGLGQKLLIEWADDVMMAAYERHDLNPEAVGPAAQGGWGKQRKVVTDGSRWLHTTKLGAHKAKNRWRLPERIPLAWDEYYSRVALYMKNGGTDEVLLDIKRKVAELGDPKSADAVRDAVQNAGTDIAKLLTVSSRLSAKLAAKNASGATSGVTSVTNSAAATEPSPAPVAST